MEITIPTRGVELQGELTIPDGATAVILFAHGSGSGRRSPRNQHMARALEARGFATVLVDLLTHDEDRKDAADAELRLDVDFLAERLIGVVDWLRDGSPLGSLPLGCLGAGTGAAAALIAAARRPDAIHAVVSRGGRPDLAEAWLPRVRAPVLFVVASADGHLLSLNRRASLALTAPTRLAVISGATDLFAEPGARDEAARATGDWFSLQLTGVSAEHRRWLGDPMC